MAKRLIDANDVEFALAGICNRESGIPLAVAEWLANVVRNAPTVDAVEVIRCKECVYNENGSCTHSEHYDDDQYRPDYFCADGERNEKNE